MFTIWITAKFFAFFEWLEEWGVGILIACLIIFSIIELWEKCRGRSKAESQGEEGSRNSDAS